MTESIFDVCIIGGGVVGCACLFDLTNDGYSCLLLEKNPNLVSEASSGNSGMLHTGFDTPLNSLELDCIQMCQRRVFTVTEKLGIPVNHIGATMVAWDDEQLQKFSEIIKKSKQAAVSDIFQLSSSELAQKEPNLRGNARGGLWIPGEAVTDPWLLPVLLANNATTKGAKVVCRGRVESCTLDTGIWQIQSTAGSFRARGVVNCAGLYGDIVDKLAGNDYFRILPMKGQYCVYDKASHHLINSSILPVPTSRTKGVIVFRTVYDNVIVGPTAEDVESRARASVDSDITEKLRRLVDSKVRGIGNYPVVGMYTGVRPATQYREYVLKCQPNRHWITVGGIRSTGVSGSLGLSDKVRHLVTDKLRLEPTRGYNSSIDKPDWHFTGRGSLMIDGRETVITHPITYFGNKMAMSRI